MHATNLVIMPASVRIRRREKEKQVEMVAPTISEEEELAKRFQDDFLLVSHLSESTIHEGAWFLDSGATRHMTGTREVFESLTKWDSDLHVRIGDQSQHAVKGVETVPFRMESGGVLRVQNVLWVPELKCNMLSVSSIEQMGFEVVFRKGKALLRPSGPSSDPRVVLGVRESGLYRLTGKPILKNNGKKVVQLRRVVQTQRELEEVSRLRGRVNSPKEVNLQVQVGERSLPRLSRRCHGLRKPCRMLRSGRLLGARCLPRRVHVIQQELLLCQREQLW
jgi:hypothetical protein